jgi:transposase
MYKFNLPASAAEVGPREEQNILAGKTMVTVFFTFARLLALNFPPKGTKFNQNYFIDAVPPDLYSERARIERRKGLPSFLVHMDNSMCHNSAKITGKPEKKHIARASRPLYSPDLSLCDFCLFGILKKTMKERASRSEEQILGLSPIGEMSSHSRISREFFRIGWGV